MTEFHMYEYQMKLVRLNFSVGRTESCWKKEFFTLASEMYFLGAIASCNASRRPDDRVSHV